ncbi:MAG: two pore domain potassium channel family protein [Chloroflexi bacterium]|nr:two pore domain potassium channel family protein [Chloroflexota bacterium]
MIELILIGFYRARRKKKLGGSVVLSALLLSIVGNAMTFFLFERSIRPDLSIGDSFWYSMISITTIGYGDLSATTLGARIGTILFITILGLTAFTASAGMLINWLIELQSRERSGVGRLYLKNHILIINYPNEARVRNIIDEYTSDSSHKNDDITVVTDRVESLPFHQPNIHFLRGSPLEMETYDRAAVAGAQKAIVLSTGYDDPNSDSIVASAVSVLHRSNPNIMATVECINSRHAVLFEGMENTSLVFPLQMANNLLVQESQDPGVSLLAQVITSNKMEGTLLSIRLEDMPEQRVSYPELAKNMLDIDVNVVGIVRDGTVHLRFKDLFPMKDDVMVYIASSRLDRSSVNLARNNG